jgi:peroxiredoxin
MTKKTIILFSFLIVSTLSYGQNVTIKGYATGAKNRCVRVKAYSDLISFKEDLLVTTYTDSSGYFEAKFKSSDIKYGKIFVDYYSSDIYIEPNKTYEIKTRTIVINDATDKENHNLNPLVFDYVILNSKPNDLNSLVQKFNIHYNNFLIKNMNLCRSKIFKAKIDTLKMNMADTFSNITNEYFKNYLKYRFAALEFQVNAASDNYLFDRYLYKQPVLFDNIEFMSFFNEFYEGYFNQADKPVRLYDIEKAVNIQKSRDALLDTLGRDTTFRNEYYREIIALKMLNMAYGMPEFSIKCIVHVLNQFAEKSKFDKVKQISKNIIWVHSRLAVNTLAPEFKISNIDGDKVSLSDFKGSIVYLGFFQSRNLACQEEFELMRKLYDKYSDTIQFVSLCCDRDSSTYAKFVKEKKYKWPILYCGMNFKLLDTYQVRSFPFYFIIDRDQKILLYPADSPSNNIEAVFKEIGRKEQKK